MNIILEPLRRLVHQGRRAGRRRGQPQESVQGGEGGSQNPRQEIRAIPGETRWGGAPPITEFPPCFLIMGVWYCGGNCPMNRIPRSLAGRRGSKSSLRPHIMTVLKATRGSTVADAAMQFLTNKRLIFQPPSEFSNPQHLRH